MEEYGQYGYGADIAYGKEIDLEKGATQRSPVGEFIFDDVFGCKPSDEQTGEEGAERQQNLCGEVVAAVEHRFSEDRQPLYGSAGERAPRRGAGEEGRKEGRITKPRAGTTGPARGLYV